MCLVSKLVEQTSCPTQFRFQIVITEYRFVDRSLFQCGSLYKDWRPALVSVVAENRKPCPPTKKKTTSNQIKEKLELEFPMCSHWSTPPIGLSLRDVCENYTWSIRAVTWDCRRVRSRTSASHVLEFQACQGKNQTPGPRADISGNGSSVHTELR
jgi:hypothetical protein